MKEVRAQLPLGDVGLGGKGRREPSGLLGGSVKYLNLGRAYMDAHLHNNSLSNSLSCTRKTASRTGAQELISIRVTKKS